MAQMHRTIYNENLGVTPRVKNNVTQSAKKVFGELKNLQNTQDKFVSITKSAVKPQRQLLTPQTQQIAKTKSHSKNNIWIDDEVDFARPCCLEKNKKPFQDIWAKKNLMDDDKLDALLKCSVFALNEDEIEKPSFCDQFDLDMDLPDISLQNLNLNVDTEDSFFTSLEMPRI